MAKLERTYNIPLRKEFQKCSIFKKTNKAVSGVRKFISKHMKSDNVKIGKELNLEIWKNGIKNPPHHVKVTAIKNDDGTVIVEKFGVKIDTEKPKPKKKSTGDTPMDTIKDAIQKKKEQKETKKKKVIKEDKKETKEEDKNA
ncbi:MAG: 50S ribosomal protein L31e [Minisyncoccales bacterium]